MLEHKTNRNSGKALMGVLLISLGVIFLLGTFGMVDLPSIWHWWPAILIVIGAAQVIAPSSGKQAASGVSLILIGLWLFACLNHWYGLRFRNAWPILLVIFGLESVVTALLDRGRKGVQPS